MNTLDDNIADPLSNIDLGLDDLKGFHSSKPEKTTSKLTINKEQLNEVATEVNFSSRQPNKPKQKVIRSTISLYPNEDKIIDDNMKSYQEVYPERHFKPSASDVIRAALYHFETMDSSQRIELIKKKRGKSQK